MNGQIKTGVGVILWREGKVLLGHRAIKGKDTGGIFEPGTWCLPGGKQEYQETILACAKREVEEETGVLIKSGQVFSAEDDIQQDKHFVTLHVVAWEFDGEPRVMEPDKLDRWKWFSLEELPENLYSPTRKCLQAFSRYQNYSDQEK